MRIGRRWLALPATVALAAMAYLWNSWGLSGVSGSVLLLAFAGVFLGPLVGAVRLGDQALRSPRFRKNLLALLAFPAAAGLLAGLFLCEDGAFVFTVVLVVLGLLVLVPCAIIATAYGPGRPGSEMVREAATSIWTLVLAGGVYCVIAVPVGLTSQVVAIERARRWVEAAAAEVRAEERRTGRLPENLEGILPRLGSAPHLIPRPNFGYVPGMGAGEFEFRVREPGAFFDEWSTYDGRSGQWKSEPD